MTIAAITSTDHLERFRAIRLEALAADPDAFGSTLEHESALDDTEWARRIDSHDGEPGQIFVVADGARDLGVVGIGCRVAVDGARDAILWGMWVRPADRGRGAARELIDAAVGWAAAQSVDTVVLSVRRNNDPAIELYRSAGFVEADGLGLAADDPCAGELGMRRPLA